MEDALHYGRDMENGLYGMVTTGVRSFGDLSANEAGMRFYGEIHFGPNPYIRCEQGQWRRGRSFDIRNYVTPAWDESVNCSEFSDAVGAVVSAVLAGRGVSCPADLARCQAIASLPCAAELVSAACLSAAGVSSTSAPTCLARLPGLPDRTVIPGASCPVETAPSSPESGYLEGAYEYVSGLIEGYLN